MTKHIILIFFVLLNLQTIGQSLSDTIVNVFFNKINDTIIIVISSKFSKEKNNLIYYKTYKDLDSIKNPITEPCYKPYSYESINSIIDSISKLGYSTGTNLSQIIKTHTEVLIKKETMDNTFENSYNYNLYRNVTFKNDTIYNDVYNNQEQRINKNRDPYMEIIKSIEYETTVWQSKDKRLLYCIFNSGRIENNMDGNEYYISTTNTAILKK